MKKIMKYKGWSLYYDKKEDVYYAYLPDQPKEELFEPEWEGGSIQELKDFIDSYDMEV